MTSNEKKLTILISGSSGLIGSRLILFLQNYGHKIYRLVRKKPENDFQIFWDPYSPDFELPHNLGIDAVVHLSGENLSKGRWSRSRKQEIIRSRVETTNNLVRAIKKLDDKPEVFICASAVGFYGNRANQKLAEDDESGNDFISSLTVEWENAARKAVADGIRVVNLRTGVVLAKESGALPRFVLPFKFGSGVILGNGSQFISWIDIEDLIAGIYYAMMNTNISGPVNMTAPIPVTNRELNKILAKIKRRPVLFLLPPFIVKMIFGDMGRELLLSSTRVYPEKLIKAGFKFRFPQLRESLEYQLGKS